MALMADPRFKNGQRKQLNQEVYLANARKTV